MSAAAKVKVTRIDPTDWYVGLKNPTLQLMVYGPNVRDAEVSVDYPNVRIDSIARLDSPNYLLVYLNLSGAQPGEMTLKIGKQKVKYLLKQREMSGDKRMGFTNADVLYMLMPDRFASSGKYTEPKAAKKLAATLNNYVVDRKQPSLRHGGDRLEEQSLHRQDRKRPRAHGAYRDKPESPHAARHHRTRREHRRRRFRQHPAYDRQR